MWVGGAGAGTRLKLVVNNWIVGLVLEAADAQDLRLAITEAVSARFDEVIEAGHGEEDLAAIYRAAAPSSG